MKSLLISLVIAFSFQVVFAQIAVAPESGTDTLEDPYMIAALENLYWISQNPAVWGSYFKQVADIDASATATWDPDGSGNPRGWTPIGNSTIKFTGVYDGGHYTICDLYINRPSSDYIGLFGWVRNATSTDWRQTIYRVGLIDANITGHNYTGALIGWFAGWFEGSWNWPVNHRPYIDRCYATGTVNGNQYVGGLIGYSDRAHAIFCYNTCIVTGGYRVGGISGSIMYHCSITYSFNTGRINGSNESGGLTGFMSEYSSITHSYSSGYIMNGTNVGGLVGTGAMLSSGSQYSFWDTETSNRLTSYTGTPKTTAQLKTRSTYGAQWDFETENRHWWMVEGETRPLMLNVSKSRIFNPYHLQMMRFNLSRDYILKRDIDLSCIQNPADIWGTNTNAEGGFAPIGTSSAPFTGSLDGNGFTISNLYIKRSATDHQSLFGACSGAAFQDLDVNDSYVKGQTYTGGIASTLSDDASISNCSFNGTVIGTWQFTGGMVGDLNSSSLTYCSTTGSVSGSSWVGGIAGSSQNDASVTNSYSRSSVTGSGRVAGFLGGSYNDTVSNCYSTGVVTGSNAVGGFIGEKTSGIAQGCYWDVLSSYQDTSAGGDGVMGKTTAEMQTQSTYTGWNFSSIWSILAEDNDGYPHLIWNGELAPPDPPLITEVSYLDGNVHLVWEEVTGASSYRIFSSDAPDGVFTEELSGSFSGASWSAPAAEPRRFYNVIAVTE